MDLYENQKEVNHINNLKKYCKIICDYNISQYILP